MDHEVRGVDIACEVCDGLEEVVYVSFRCAISVQGCLTRREFELRAVKHGQNARPIIVFMIVCGGQGASKLGAS